jgi:broad specificity phosphatase PhoE
VPRITADEQGSTRSPDSAEEGESASAVRRWPAPDTKPALVLVRHGETEWSRNGQHTGATDIPLTERGEQQARASGPLIRAVLGSAEPALVLSSPRQRAWRTAELAGFAVEDIVADAAEWDYGELEGRTSADIGKDWPDWSVWSGPIPGGEDAAAVTVRFDRLLGTVTDRLSASGRTGPVLVFSHGHAIRCLAARWLGEPVTAGRRFWLGTGAVCSLGYEHGHPAVLHWNLDSELTGAGQ